MTKALDPFSYWSRAFSAWEMMAATAVEAMTTFSVSQQVIQAREPILRGALGSPRTADYVELSRMVTEKLSAFSASGAVVSQAWWNGQLEWTALLNKAGSGMTPWTPGTAQKVATLWVDAIFAMLKLTEISARMGRDSLAPIYRTATANARRLGQIA